MVKCHLLFQMCVPVEEVINKDRMLSDILLIVWD